MAELQLKLPVTRNDLTALKAGDLVRLSGTFYTARDQAHKKLADIMKAGQPLPFELAGNAIYYCGPTPPRADNRFGSAGPTTSARMDGFTPPLYAAGLAATIGKGGRSRAVREACRDYQAVYFTTFGGAGAYLAMKITSQKLLAFPELGAEAIYECTIEDFPVIVGYDTAGNSAFPEDQAL